MDTSVSLPAPLLTSIREMEESPLEKSSEPTLSLTKAAVSSSTQPCSGNAWR
jgi:hypothetical protein